MHLPLPDHVPDLLSVQGSPRTLQGKEAHPGLDQPFDKAVVLLDQIIQVKEDLDKRCGLRHAACSHAKYLER